VRVAYLVSQYPAVNHTFILREVRGLRALGMDVAVASILARDRVEEKLSADEREEATSTFYVRPQGRAGLSGALVRALFARPTGFVRGLGMAFRLSRWNIRTALRHLLYVSEAAAVGLWMARKGLRHLHTHFASTTALFVRAMFPVTISATIHGPDEFNDAVGFLLPEKVHAVEFVVAISNYGASQLMRVSDPADWNKIRVARLGVDPAEFSPRPVKDSEPGEYEIICVGRLAPAKAHMVLLEACAALQAHNRPFRLRLVGDGPDRKRLEAAAGRLGIAARVIFEGALSHDRVLELYRSADLFALASFAEGLPVVLMEAMAMQIPCVATHITGIPELIQNGVDGLLVPPADPGALARAIELVIDDHELRACIARAGRRKILLDYDAAANISKVYSLFAQIPGLNATE
jgi:colanic acid/amylovoran biosynthesis glycosyltransferase